MAGCLIIQSRIDDKAAIRLTFHVPFNYFYFTHKNQFDMKHQIDFQVGIRTDFTRKHAYYESSDFIKCKAQTNDRKNVLMFH